MLEDFLRQLAPIDVDGMPLYALYADDVPNGFLPVGASGVTGRPLDLALQSHLETSGQWKGRGPALIVDAGAAQEMALAKADAVGGLDVEDFCSLREALIASIALHEFAHTLSRSIDTATDKPHEAIEALWTGAASRPFEETFTATLPPWFQHGADYIRALCHLAYRAEVDGHMIVADAAFASDIYELSSLDDYREALGDEPKQLFGCSFAAIRATRPPEAFVELWQSDLQAWERANETDDESADIFAAAVSMFDDKPSPLTIQASLKAPEVCAIALHAAATVVDSKAGLLKPAKFRVTPYTGGALDLPSYSLPVVIDLAGVTFATNIVAWLDRSNDSSRIVGHCTTQSVAGGKILLAGICSGCTPSRDEVVESARDGFPWDAIVRAVPGAIDALPAGQSATVNGRTFDGPLYIARSAKVFGFVFGIDGDNESEVDIEAQRVAGPELQAG